MIQLGVWERNSTLSIFPLSDNKKKKNWTTVFYFIFVVQKKEW
jgi:hypothetical protein